MALLQIAEPGQTAVPHERKFALGIDLGTTNSLVATVRSGSAEALPDLAGDSILPSVVHYAAGGDVLVGREAMALSAEAPLDTLHSVKRFMGRGTEDVSGAEYDLVSGDGGMVSFRTSAGEISPGAMRIQLFQKWL